MILVVGELRGGGVARPTWEAVEAARAMADGAPVALVLLGASLDRAAAQARACGVSMVYTAEHPLLERYAADAHTEALVQIVRRLTPDALVLPHTYQTRDFAPKLAVRLDVALVTDVVGVAHGEAGTTFARPMFQGRVIADVVPEGPPPHIVTVQAGAFRAIEPVAGDNQAALESIAVVLDAAQVRQRPEPPFQDARQTVDLSRAERIVAVGRGLKERERLPVAQALADALHAELAASRPICDAGWMPMDRQVGSSGQTVAPALYVALGISGAIQHVVGMKGARVVVAINKDRDAPIFDVADYGIVGDLFEVVPALVDALKVS